ncbi:MAG: aminotransferase DegT [Cytophagaceae bacterium SCN 52-12]|nr:MAG: aminotransferase DegT [Cytophagaceae bacterium SCN 52-12]
MSKEHLAFYGGRKSVEKNFGWPVFDDNEIKAVEEVLRSGKWGSPNCQDKVAEFEQAFAGYCGTKYAVSCVNGSVSLRIAVIASGIRPGDEVIVPPYTFIATASTVIECNAVPVFVDIEPGTFNLDPAKIEAAITPRTKAIIPVHFGGLACDMDSILAIAEKHGLTVIEDAAHGHGAEYKGRKLGSIGKAGSFSFQSSKNMTSGEGGVVVTNDEEMYKMMASLRNVGRLEEGQWYDHFNAGCNYRLTQMQAVMLTEQLKRLEVQTRIRHDNGRYLAQLLNGIEGIEPLKSDVGETLNCYHLFIFRYRPEAFGGLGREEFVNLLGAEGIPCLKGYPHPLYKQPLFQEKRFMCYAIPESADYTGVYCEEAEKACNESVWILQNSLLGDKSDMEAFAEAIRKIKAAFS